MTPGCPSPPGPKTRHLSVPRRPSMRSISTDVRMNDLRWAGTLNIPCEDVSFFSHSCTKLTLRFRNRREYIHIKKHHKQWICNGLRFLTRSWMSSWRPTSLPSESWRRCSGSCPACLQRSRPSSAWTTHWAARLRSSTARPSRGYTETRRPTSSMAWRKTLLFLSPSC